MQALLPAALLAVTLVESPQPAGAQASSLAATPAGQSNPSSAMVDWQTATPESLGFSTARLEALRAWLRTEPTASMMIVAKGKVIFTYGDVSHVSKIASIRKSILSMLMGKYVVAGTLDMNKTVSQMGLEDGGPFLPIEQGATLEQLMAARAGIVIGSDAPGPGQPARGAFFPGSSFWYDNWVFDAAGTAFRKGTGRNIYDALQADLAIPLGMQDFHRELQQEAPSPGSIHPEFAMFLSTRDMARLGLLMEQYGVWNGKPLLSADWVRYTTDISTHWDDMNPPFLRAKGDPGRWGFGSAWWVWDAKPYVGGVYDSPLQGAYEARGSGGQYITVIPSKNLVLVHKVDLLMHPDAASWMKPGDWSTLTSMVIAAQVCPGPCRP